LVSVEEVLEETLAKEALTTLLARQLEGERHFDPHWQPLQARMLPPSSSSLWLAGVRASPQEDLLAQAALSSSRFFAVTAR
jgi:hypothetical protein